MKGKRVLFIAGGGMFFVISLEKDILFL